MTSMHSPSATPPAGAAPILAVRECGAGKPLTLLHGLGSSSRYWGNFLPLATRYRVIAPDLLGFGRSPRPAHAAYGVAEHLEALHATLNGRVQEPLSLLGHSMGSVLALHYAVRFPAEVRRLVLMSLPVLGNRPWGHGDRGLLARWHRFEAHSRTGAALFDAGMRLVRPLWNVVGPSLRRNEPPDAVRDALAGSWTAYWRTLEAVVYGADLPALLAKAPMPVTLIHGAEDRTAQIAAVRALAARHSLTLVEIAGAAHNPWFTHRQATAHAIEQALAG